MFDVGFWELATIGLIAMLILGPERLPKFAYDCGRVVRKIRRFVQTTKEEVKRDLEIERMKHLNDDIHQLDNFIKDVPRRFKPENPLKKILKSPKK